MLLLKGQVPDIAALLRRCPYLGRPDKGGSTVHFNCLQCTIIIHILTDMKISTELNVFSLYVVFASLDIK